MKRTLSLLISFLFFLFPVFSQDIEIPDIITWINQPVVEQRQSFTKEEIDSFSCPDLPSLMEAAGIQLLSYGPYGLEQKPSIRGFTDETVRVIINGICVNNAQYGTFDFSSINIEDIEHIEIVRGGFTEEVSDEGAVGGAIYITTKKQSLGQQFSSNTLIKSYFNYYQPADTFSQSAGFNGQVGDNSFIKANLKGTWAGNKYLYQNYQNRRTERQHAEVLDGSANIDFLYFYGNGNSIGITDLFYTGNKNTPGPDSSKKFGNQKDFDNNLTLQLINPAITKGLRMENTLSWLKNVRFYNDNSRDSTHLVDTFKYAATFNLYKFQNFTEAAGITLDYVHLNSTDDGLHNQFSGTFKTTTKYQKGIFGFTLPLGVKFSNKNFAFTPKAGIGIKTKHLDVLVDGYRMVQFPNMDDLYWDDGTFHGNQDLLPESGWGGDFTINLHDVWLPFSVCLFSNYYYNKIQWAGNSPQNVASAFYLGADLSFEKHFLSKKITIRGKGEYLYTKLMDKSKNTYGKKIMWTPDFTGSITINYNLPAKEKRPAMSFSAEGNYMGKRYTSNLNTSYLNPYFLLNLKSEIKISHKKWEISPYIRIDNLLNTSYVSVTSYPMPGINGTLGIKLKLRTM